MILDIETYALDEAKDFIEEPSAPANYKDPLKIAAYIEEAKTKAVSKCALDMDLCRVVAIGLRSRSSTGVVVLSHDDTTEAENLEWLWRTLWNETHPLIGFNILSFDLPVLIRRSQYLGVDVAPSAWNLDRYRTPHIDLMQRLSFNQKDRTHSLDFYCRRFGIAVEDQTNGSDIDGMVRTGNWDGVAAHCKADLAKTAQLAQRLGLFQIGLVEMEAVL